MSIADRIASAAAGILEAAAARVRPAPGARGDEVAIPAPWIDRRAAVLGNAVDPEVLSRIILKRNDGYLAEWCDLADHARRTYPHLHAQLSTREQSAQETEFEVVAGAGPGGNRAEAACRELWAEWQRNGWETWCAEIVGAKFYPAGLHEVSWARADGLIAPTRLTRIAERRLSYACPVYDPEPWALRIWDPQDFHSPFQSIYGLRVDSFHPDKFLVHEHRVAGGHRASEGLFAVVCWYWLFGVYSWRDMMALLEMLGRPPVVGYYAAGGAKSDGNTTKLNGDRNATQAEIAAAKAAVGSVSGALRAILPDTVRLEAIKFEVPAQPHQILTADKVNELISKAINGTTGVTDIVAGARASHEVAMEQSLTPYRADVRSIARVGTELFRRFVRANPDYFGARCEPPTLMGKVDPPAERKELATVLEIAKRTGVRIPESWAHEALQIPVAKASERVLGDAPEGTTAPATKAPQIDAKADAAPDNPTPTDTP